MDADIVMSRENDTGDWFATWRGAAHVGIGSLTLGSQETQTGAPPLMPDVTREIQEKKKNSRHVFHGLGQPV